MLVRDSKKHQPEFDLAEASRVYSSHGLDKQLDAGNITSPYDLFAVETLRDRLDIRTGRATPTDVFVFGKGEPPQRDCTQIGGNPSWPATRKWPTGADGKPYRFFAQINFADSKDLLSDLPGDLLLIFISDAEDWYWEPMQVHFEWVALGSHANNQIDPSLIAQTGGPFFGAIFRTADYPEPAKIAYEDGGCQNYRIPILQGTKIGGEPYFVQSGEGVTGQFLCEIYSIQAAHEVPFPWLNHAEPLDLGFGPNSIHSKGNEVMLGDLGAIYLYRDAEGRVRSAFECS